MLYESEYYGIVVMPDIIAHHGIKGMKWGVRRYQNKDGTLTAEGKAREKGRSRIVRSESSTKDVEGIISSMNDTEKDWVLAGSDHYLNTEERSTLAKRVVVKDDKGTAVSFFDFLEDGNDMQIALGTRSGDNYRGKGYASKAASQAMKWLDTNQDKIKQRNAVYGVNVNNKASIRIAEKNGFTKDENSYSDDGQWVNYVRPIHTKKRRR